jgi:hypothetical protein
LTYEAPFRRNRGYFIYMRILPETRQIPKMPWFLKEKCGKPFYAMKNLQNNPVRR